MTLLDNAIARELVETMHFRCIGPTRGGRCVAVAGDPSAVATFYFGAVAGGIWKTTDAGTTWVNVSDGQLGTSSVGALAVSPSDPNVIYAGMGESCIRIDVSHGDGVYRSGDGGRTWTHLGLANTRHIGEIRIHPKNPDLVYVAALGNAFGHNTQRGVFGSNDGGKTWKNILYVSERAGAVDISLDPHNPETIYATIWQAHRNFWELSSGGPDSGLWKSTDGGDTWTEITHNQGLLPESAIVGKIGVSASPARPGRVWALVESSQKPGLYRSDDAGDTWKLVNEKVDLRYRPWYYMHVFADTTDPDTVWVNNLEMWKSTDGGEKFTRIPTPHGDNHDLWIDPVDNQRMIQGNDGGANVSFNGGESWSTIYNQPTAQFYTVATDNRRPYYHVYGTQQDNSSVAVPSGARDGAIVWADCYPAGTGESGFVAVHPEDDDLVFVGAVGSAPGGGGSLQRYDHRTKQIRMINVWPEYHEGIGPGELEYRFPWTFPILFSPHDPKVLYAAGNVVFRSTDEGHTWTPISGDLSRNDPHKLGVSGGPITKDTSGAEHYCTVSTLRECPHEEGVLWAGTDDGRIHVTHDGGESWQEVTPPDLPEWTFVRTVEPSPHEKGTVYLAATGYKVDDTTPYLYRSGDYGKTWTQIVGRGEAVISDDTIVRVIRADPNHQGLLYVGTETGLYISTDDGESWHRWQSDLPVTPIYDLTIKGSDLVIATHGRAFWICDDLTPIYQLLEDQPSDDLRLFQPRDAWRILPDLFGPWVTTEGKDYWASLGKAATFVAEPDETGQVRRTYLDAGESAPIGVTVTYVLPESHTEEGTEVALEFLDADGEVVRRFEPEPPGRAEMDEAEKAFYAGPWITTKPGINRFVWDLRYEGAIRVLGNKLAKEANTGPLVVPGTYQVRLVASDASGETITLAEEFQVSNDPRSDVSQEALEEQLKALLQIRDHISRAYEAVKEIRAVKSQLTHWTQRSDLDEVGREAGRSLESALGKIEDKLMISGQYQDTFGLNEPARLSEKLASVIPIIASADARPTQNALEVAGKYQAEIDEELATLDRVFSEDLRRFNEMLAKAELPAVHR